MQNEEKIIEAIAAKLQQYDTLNSIYDVEEMAKSIYAAIAPHLGEVEQDWSDVPTGYNWKTTSFYGEVIFWENKPNINPNYCKKLERRPQ